MTKQGGNLGEGPEIPGKPLLSFNRRMSLAGERLQPLGHPSSRRRGIRAAGGPLHSGRSSTDQAAWDMLATMDERPTESEAYIRHLVAAIEAAEAMGIVTPQAIADHLNAASFTSRKGRPWTGTAVEKFLASPGVARYRST
jgi:transposase InsO family protein